MSIRAETVPGMSTIRAVDSWTWVSSRYGDASASGTGHGVMLAEHSILPDVEFDVQQAATHLDHTAWSAIALEEAEITAHACARLASNAGASASDAVAT